MGVAQGRWLGWYGEADTDGDHDTAGVGHGDGDSGDSFLSSSYPSSYAECVTIERCKEP